MLFLLAMTLSLPNVDVPECSHRISKNLSKTTKLLPSREKNNENLFQCCAHLNNSDNQSCRLTGQRCHRYAKDLSSININEICRWRQGRTLHCNSYHLPSFAATPAVRTAFKTLKDYIFICLHLKTYQMHAPITFSLARQRNKFRINTYINPFAYRVNIYAS